MRLSDRLPRLMANSVCGVEVKVCSHTTSDSQDDSHSNRTHPVDGTPGVANFLSQGW